MADSRTRIDVLYKEVLGDVHVILDQVDRLKCEYATLIDQSNAGLEYKIQQLIKSANELAESANQAHYRAAIKHAAEAKAEIMNAARASISFEVEKSSAIVTNAAHQLSEIGREIKGASRKKWTALIGLAVLSGVVAASIVLVGLHFMLG